MCPLFNKYAVSGQCVCVFVLIVRKIYPTIKSCFFYTHLSEYTNHLLRLICYFIQV
ncbi:hypothetical protein Metal_2592 [Methylomicrobium album BG8]|uniref:Uncharacterized protein n=1 Tax=Methylomicrobium album BG8 TaxID=686340 RepID=H8GIW7_METAL|nr:hypothetical protein Metal_2592 [Methylomicrobium album BG8]